MTLTRVHRASSHSHTRPLIANHSFFLLHTTQLFDFSLLRSFPPPHLRASNAANNQQKEKQKWIPKIYANAKITCTTIIIVRRRKINREMGENQRREKVNKNSDQLIIHRASFAFISSSFAFFFISIFFSFSTVAAMYAIRACRLKITFVHKHNAYSSCRTMISSFLVRAHLNDTFFSLSRLDFFFAFVSENNGQNTESTLSGCQDESGEPFRLLQHMLYDVHKRERVHRIKELRFGTRIQWLLNVWTGRTCDELLPFRTRTAASRRKHCTIRYVISSSVSRVFFFSLGLFDRVNRYNYIYVMQNIEFVRCEEF